MNKSSTVLIYNVHAGRGGKRREVELARFSETMSALGIEIEVMSTARPGEATTLASRAVENGAKTIIVSGGDGTINEALQGIIGSETQLAIWPRGTANVTAHEPGLPTKIEIIAEMIARGKTKQIIPGCAIMEETGERRYFLLMAGMGLDASVVKGVRPALKRHTGKAAFWYSGLEHLASWEPVPFNVEAEGQSFTATFAVVGKGSLYGGGLSVTPRASLDQPEFELCIMSAKSRLRYLRLLASVVNGGVANDTKDVRFIRTTKARVTGDVAIQLDGELVGKPPMTFEIAASPIEIVVP